MPQKIAPLTRSALAECGELDGLRALSRIVLLVLAALIIAAFVAPWTQTAPGQGRVVAYSPADRETPIRAPISGRVMRWLVNEGDGVTKGQAIAELADNDPNILARLGSARDATLSQSSAIASAIRVAEGQVDALIDAREAGLELAKAKVQIAREKQQEAEQKEIAAKAKRETASINLTRQRSLNEKGLLSDRNLELAELAVATASSEALQAAASLRAARRSVGAAESSLAETQQKNRASVEKARGELELRAEAGKITAKTAEAETKLARQEQMTILAPRDGRILSIRAREGSDFVKTGDVMAMLIPDTHNRAVELWVDGNDAPLVTQGRKVRLQFEGWPAVQFVGWPSMAVGTFGGAVSYIDPSSRVNGDVRIMVVPDPESDPWPEAQYLRQGVRARGWILLNRVTVAYELWRQFNGFPPSIESAPSTNKKVGK